MRSKPVHKLLNPFVFVAETDARFWLFYLAITLLGIYIISSLPYLFYDTTFGNTWNLGYEAINAEFDPASPFLSETLAEQIHRGAIIPLFVIVWIVGLWYAVKWYASKNTHKVISDPSVKAIEDIPENAVVLEHLNSIVQEIGIRKPIFYLTEKNIGGGQAIEGPKQPYIILQKNIIRGLKMPHTRDISTALILHELSHVANKDLSKSMMSISLWKVISRLVFPLFGLLIFLSFLTGLNDKMQNGLSEHEIQRIWTVNIPTVTKEYVMLVALGVVFYMIYASILRTREFYADWRAGILGHRQTLVNLLGTKEDTSVSIWKSLFRFHPTAQRRVTVLQNPNALYHPSWELCLIVGFCLAVLLIGAEFLSEVTLFLSKIFNYIISLIFSEDSKLRYTLIMGVYVGIFALVAIMFAIVGKVVFNSIGVQIEKSVIVCLSRHQKYSKKQLVIAAIFMTLGFWIGRFLTPLVVNVTSLYSTEILKMGIIYSVIFILNLCWLWFVLVISKKLFLTIQNTVQKRHNLLANTSTGLMLAFYLFIFYLIVICSNKTFLEVISTSVIVVLLGFLCFLLFWAITYIIIKLRFPVRQNCFNCKENITDTMPLLGKTCPHCQTNFCEELWLINRERVIHP